MYYNCKPSAQGYTCLSQDRYLFTVLFYPNWRYWEQQHVLEASAFCCTESNTAHGKYLKHFTLIHYMSDFHKSGTKQGVLFGNQPLIVLMYKERRCIVLFSHYPPKPIVKCKAPNYSKSKQLFHSMQRTKPVATNANSTAETKAKQKTHSQCIHHFTTSYQSIRDRGIPEVGVKVGVKDRRQSDLS